MGEGQRHQPAGRWQEKLIFSWRVFLSLDLTPGNSCILPRYYNVEYNDEGQLRFGNRHAYRKDYIAANNGRHPSDWNKLPIALFEKGLFLIEVVTVVRDSNGPLPSALHYSKVKRIIRPLEENERLIRIPL